MDFRSSAVGAARPYRLAIVGAGLITRNSHLPTALSLPGVQVCALIDPVTTRASELAADYGLDVLVAPDAGAVIGQVDAAIIATPNHTHRQIAVPLLEAGISTFIEKPLATTVQDGTAIVEAARRGKTKVALGYHQRFLDSTLLLERLLAQGYFGRVTRFCHQFGTAGGWPALSAYTLKRESVGGGVLVVTGTHFLDRMLHLWGMPDEVQLFDDSHGGPEAHCEGRVRYENLPGGPLEGTFRYSKSVPLRPGLVLETERGTVIVPDGTPDRVILLPQGDAGLRHEIVATVDSRFPSNFDTGQRMLWDFVSACREDRAPMVDAEMGRLSLELLARLYANREPLADRWVEVGGAA